MLELVEDAGGVVGLLGVVAGVEGGGGGLDPGH
jgi:hypothetical protein